MEINCDLTEEDYINFNLFHVKNSKTASKSLNLQRYLGPVFFIIAAYIFTRIGDIPFLFPLIIFSLISILWIVFYPTYFYSLVTRNVKKMLKEGKNDGLLGEHQLIMTEEGIADTTSNGETKLNWTGVKNLKEDDAYFYIYTSSVSAYIIPKRELTNAEETRNYLTSKIRS